MGGGHVEKPEVIKTFLDGKEIPYMTAFGLEHAGKIKVVEVKPSPFPGDVIEKYIWLETVND